MTRKKERYSRRLCVMRPALLAALLGTVCLLPGCKLARQDTKQPEIQVLTIGTADSGGTMYPVGRAIAEVLNEYAPSLKINTSASSGSCTNVENLRAGQIDIGLISGDVAYCAYRGTEEFEGRPMKELRAVGAVYLSLSNWMAPDSLGVEYVHDLLGKRVAVGPEDSTTELSARVALNVVGINSENTTLKNQGLGTGAAALKSRELDALHAFAGIPVKGLSDLALQEPCHLLRFTDEELDAILSENQEYAKGIIPAGTYPGQTEDEQTFGVKCLLCVSADMEDELVKTMTRIIWESSEELKGRHPALSALKDDFMSKGSPIPLHPGAEQFYQSVGLLNSEID